MASGGHRRGDGSSGCRSQPGGLGGSAFFGGSGATGPPQRLCGRAVLPLLWRWPQGSRPHPPAAPPALGLLGAWLPGFLGCAPHAHPWGITCRLNSTRWSEAPAPALTWLSRRLVPPCHPPSAAAGLPSGRAALRGRVQAGEHRTGVLQAGPGSNLCSLLKSLAIGQPLPHLSNKNVIVCPVCPTSVRRMEREAGGGEGEREIFKNAKHHTYVYDITINIIGGRRQTWMRLWLSVISACT